MADEARAARRLALASRNQSMREVGELKAEIADLKVENDTLKLVLIRKRVITAEEIEAEKRR